MFKEFKQFVFRGNTVDLAVGIVVGTAFRDIVTALVKDILTPVIAAVVGEVPDFANLSFVINKSRFMYGDFINSGITFLLIFLALFFFVVRPMNVLVEHTKKTAPLTKKCTECLSEIPLEAKRCSFCGQKQ
ncbi:MAG: large conductance mechanosensitive channel protein MscL [Candidatus Parcubacteria bacterium]|nr:large conductance mechanosensitive channel protein MscL [Candidatus Parcubacteria bacterium]